eukprot:PhM_4_TR2957/c0_g1_i1/m.50475
MSFSIFVAADVFGAKTNFELTFAQRPPVTEVVRTVEKVFTSECNFRRPDGVPSHSFNISKLKVFDDVVQKWIDLVSDAQVGEWCQIYAFQVENPWHRETQKEIPPAVKPPPSHYGNVPHPSNTHHTSGMMAGTPLPAVTTSAPISYPRVSSGSVHSVVSMPSNGAGALVSRPGLDANATLDEKVRVVFAEFDQNGDRVIEIEELKAGFRNLGVDFSSATLRDLFQKGDANNDGRISFAEFERFARLYPIMLDCLYFRSRLFMDDLAMQQELAQERDAVKAAREAASVAQSNHMESARVIDEMQQAIATLEKEIQVRSQRMREVSVMQEQATRERDRAQKERNERDGELNSMRDRERIARAAQNECIRELEVGERRANVAAHEAKAADDKVRQLQQALAEAQRQAERARENARETAATTDQIRSRERDASLAVENVLRDLPRLEDLVRQADANVINCTDRVRELEAVIRESQRDADEVQHKRDATDRQLVTAREQEQRCLESHREAQRAAEDRERRMQAREAELLEQQRQRHLVTQHEKQLMEQELRLREQRDSLEEKESKLKADATSFLSHLRSTLSQRSANQSTTSGSPYVPRPW